MIVQKAIYWDMGGKDAQNFGEGDFIVNVYYTFIKCKSFQVKDFDLTVSI